MRTNFLKAVVPAILFVALARAGAQIPLSGSVFDGGVGPLAPGTYTVSGSITVPSGQTLTMQPGVVVKFGTGAFMSVSGTLLCGTVGGAEVFLTSTNDDSVGIDVTPGSTGGAPGDWRGVAQSGAVAVVDLRQTTIRFTGFAGSPAVTAAGGGFSLRNVSIANTSAFAVDLNNTAPSLIDQCDFRNTTVPIADAPLAGIPAITNCTASGSVDGDTIRVTGGVVAGSTTIGVQNTLNQSGALLINVTVTIQAGGTLTIGGGVALKVSAGQFVTVAGTLNSHGVVGNPAIFTSTSDDAVAGDSTNDGPTNGAAGDWRGINQAAGGVLDIRRTSIRFTGFSGNPAISVQNNSVVVDDVTIADASAVGIDFNNISPTQISSTSFTNTQSPFADVALAAVPTITNCTATGSLLGDAIRVTNGTIGGVTTIAKVNTINQSGVLLINAPVTVQSAGSLNLLAGMILKMAAGQFLTIDGVLTTGGTSGSPVVFTSQSDDSVGGDSLNDGLSSGFAGEWRGLTFNTASDASSFAFAEVRFSGFSGSSALELNGADIDILDVLITESSTAGIDLNSNSAPTMARTTIESCPNSIIAAPISSLAGFRDLSASGIANGAPIRVVQGSIGPAAVIHAYNLIDRTIVVPAALTIGPADGLTILEGVVVKTPAGGFLTVNGRLDLLGTGLEPIIFTSTADDAVVADATGDGATLGIPGQIRGITYSASAQPSRAQNVVVRFGGFSGSAGLALQSAQLIARSLRAERSSGDGFRITNLSGDGFNFVAHHCGGDGFELAGGTFKLIHATSADNGSAGFRRIAPWNSQVVSSVGFGNTAGNYIGFAAANLSASNGDAALSGTNGNINADPLFVDPSSDDYRLGAGSPSIGTADFNAATIFTRDHDDRSRILDDALTGSALPDMGAYERDVFRIGFTGEPRTGTAMSIAIDGDTAGNGVVLAGLDDGGGLYAPFGFLNAGNHLFLVLIGAASTGQSINVDIPAVPFLEGFRFAIQAVVVDASNPTIGGFTNVYRAEIFN